MTKRIRAEKKPLFVGCEGSSETSYATLLARLASSSPGIRTHVNAQNLNPGAGDPVALVKAAEKKIVGLERLREPFNFKCLLLDVGSDQKNREAEALAIRCGIDLLIWQTPDHEAFLLRHLPGTQNLRPPAGASMVALKKKWPEYVKGVPALKIAQKIALENILAAAEVEPGLKVLLKRIGFISE